MTDKDLLFEQIDGIGVVTLNRPAARNALTFDMYEGLASICTDIEEKKLEVGALVIKGSGEKAFAAGTDISKFKDLKTAEQAISYERRMDRVLGTIESVPVPTVAAIRGACTGGGAAIAACCDFRITSADLKFGFPIARTLGNCLSVGNLSRLVELLGSARTRDLLFTSRLMLADEALSIALVNEIVEDPFARAMELCTTMQQHAPLTIAASKEGLKRLRQHAANVDGDDLIIECYTSNDFREGMDAFLSKRKPEWTGT